MNYFILYNMTISKDVATMKTMKDLKSVAKKIGVSVPSSLMACFWLLWGQNSVQFRRAFGCLETYRYAGDGRGQRRHRRLAWEQNSGRFGLLLCRASGCVLSPTGMPATEGSQCNSVNISPGGVRPTRIMADCSNEVLNSSASQVLEAFVMVSNDTLLSNDPNI